MIRRLALLLVLVMPACSNTPVRIDSRADTDSRAMSELVARDPEHFIIAAVDNAAVPFVSQAGGTPHGYDGIAGYGPSLSARRMLSAVEHEYGLREVSAWPIQPLHVHCALLEIPDGAVRDTLLAKMSKDARIKLAQPLQTFATRTAHYNDPYVGLQRGFDQMDIAGAHVLSRGEGIKVAIIDTGADVQHLDLRGNVASAVNFVDSDKRRFLRDRHGTEVAGVIAAIANNGEGIVGVAPDARLLLFKACWQTQPADDAATCNSFTLAKALVAALNAHAQIVNLSLSGPADPLLNGLIREGIRRGVFFVLAVDPTLPGQQDGLSRQAGVIEVASAGKRAARGLAVYAPGREILTLLPGGHYDFASGDSIATAHVSGVLALLLARQPSLTATAAYQLLHDTSTRSGEGADGGEVIDACAALVSLVGHGVCDGSALRAAARPAP